MENDEEDIYKGTQPAHHRKVHEDSPDRCQATNTHGQCNNVKIPGCNVCIIHGGGHQQKSNKTAEVKNYRLTQFRARVNEFAENPNVKNLREELGIVRLQLEFLINKCKDDTDLLLYSDRISKLINQIQLLVLSCQKLEEKSGNLLDKAQLFVICESFVQIVSEHITDPDALDNVANKIMDLLTKSIATDPLGENVSSSA